MSFSFSLRTWTSAGIEYQAHAGGVFIGWVIGERETRWHAKDPSGTPLPGGPWKKRGKAAEALKEARKAGPPRPTTKPTEDEATAILNHYEWAHR